MPCCGSAPTAAWKRAWCRHTASRIDTIAIKGLRGKGIAALLTAPMRVLARSARARAWSSKRNPRAVVSFGGYAAGPGGIAAQLRGTPLIVHEQNRAPGMTNRVLARSRSAC